MRAFHEPVRDTFEVVGRNKASEILQGKTLAKGTGISPSSKILQLTIEQTNKVVLAYEETQPEVLGITTLHDKPYAGGAYFKEYKLKGPIRIVLYDRNGKPVALCTQEAARMKTYTICGTNPLVDGDEAYVTQEGVDFYRWFHVHDTRDDDGYPILLWNGKVFQRFLKAVPTATEFHELLQHVALCELVIKDDENHGHDLARIVEGWRLEIAPYTDPAMILCVAIVLDKIIPISYHESHA